MLRSTRAALRTWIAVALMAAALRPAVARADIVVLPENNTKLTILRDGESYIDLELVGWGPEWSWLGFRGEVRREGEGSLLAGAGKIAQSGAELSFRARVAKTSARQLRIVIDVRSSKDTELTYIVATLAMSPALFKSGRVVSTATDDSRRSIVFPLEKKPLGESVKRIELIDSRGDTTGVTLDPPRAVPSDGAARIVLAAGKLRADSPSRTVITMELPADTTYYASSEETPTEPGLEDWFEFRPSDDHDAPSAIGMQDWLERPAGKHGRITRRGDALIYNGKPVKLWGLNLCYGTCAPEKELADKRASFYAKYGVNAVRLHKYADGPGWAGIQSERSFMELDPAGLDRMDYFIAQLAKRGIYTKLSAHFGSQKLGPDDKSLVPYLEEFGSFSGRTRRITTPHSAVHYARELQDVQIRQMLNLLKHRNPYTGRSYAEDPAIAFIEIINEQSILFYSSMKPLEASATLRQQIGERFCAWLRERYGTQAALEKGWGGRRAFDSFAGEGFPERGEHLDKNNILPLGNPWFWDPAQLEGTQAYRRQRLLDTLLFLYGQQNEFYSRYVQAVRKAGYRGEIVSSNWQAGRALSHYYNLHSDALVGVVDRHNYFGGGSGSRIDNSTMLRAPGSGTLSAGMQQVANRPFMLSEWIHVAPNEWGVEGPAVIGAYGLGLQGWDVSYLFQNRDNGAFSSTVGRDRWDVTAPQVLGVFPAVARQVLRSDVRESALVVPVRVHVPSLHEGKIGFDDRVTQKHDVKTFESDKVPAEALAVARCVVEFTEDYEETPRFDVTSFLEGGSYTSSTKQLRWRAGRSKLDGFFTIDTAATKAVIGFAQGQTCELGDVTITPRSRYGAIYLTARELDRDLTTSRELLVVAIARARNTGMKVFGGDRLLDKGKSPVLMEPVRGEITVSGRGSPTVEVLDHSGKTTGKTIRVTGETFTIDGARDQTCYYLVTYPETGE